MLVGCGPKSRDTRRLEGRGKLAVRVGGAQRTLVQVAPSLCKGPVLEAQGACVARVGMDGSHTIAVATSAECAAKPSRAAALECRSDLGMVASMVVLLRQSTSHEVKTEAAGAIWVLSDRHDVNKVSFASAGAIKRGPSK